MKARTIMMGLLLLGSVTLFAQVRSRPLHLAAHVNAIETAQKKEVKRVNPLYARSIGRNTPALIDQESASAGKASAVAVLVTSGIRAFPNPFTSQIDIIITDGAMSRSEYKATLYDISGKKVHAEALTANQSSLELSQLSKGIYFLHVEKNGMLIKSEKFVKE